MHLCIYMYIYMYIYIYIDACILNISCVYSFIACVCHGVFVRARASPRAHLV